MAYDVVLRMMKEPVRLMKATGLPSGMAPRPVAMTAVDLCQRLVFPGQTRLLSQDLPQKMVAGIGQLSRSFTWANRPEKGTALSRARAQ